MTRASKVARDAGVAERQLHLAERWGAVLAGILMQVFEGQTCSEIAGWDMESMSARFVRRSIPGIDRPGSRYAVTYTDPSGVRRTCPAASWHDRRGDRPEIAEILR